MKRTKATRPIPADLILCGDWHLREDQPTCRTDDYWSAQWEKIEFIKTLQRMHNCPVIQPGDFFDYWKPSPRLLAQTFIHLPDNVLAVYGNHDLPQHSLDLAEKCGLYALSVGAPDKLTILPGTHWGQQPAYFVPIAGRKILVWHIPVYMGKALPWPGAGVTEAAVLLKQNPEYDLIVTGDLHKRCVARHEGRLLVNAGSITRMTADQVDYDPSVFLWYADTNEVERIELPFRPGVVSREHIDRKEEKESRYEAFIERLRKGGRPEMSFQANLERHFTENKTVPSVRELIYKMLEDENA